MDSAKNISLIALIGLTTVLAVQLLKDNFAMIENYGENFAETADSVPSNNQTSFTYKPSSNQSQQVKQTINNINPNLDMAKHGNKPFGEGGDFFTQPLISDTASTNGYNMTPEAYKVYMATISAGTPTEQNFNAISNSVSGTNELPGPGNWLDNTVSVNSQELTGRAADLSLCAQNMSSMASGSPGGIASSLLPGGGIKSQNVEGFSDCNVQNVLANQTFLSARSGGVIGTDTVAGSLRNGNQSIRSDPPNPLQYVGPWNLSTIYPDLLRRPLEGCGPSFGLYGNGPLGSQVPVKMNPGIN